MEQDPNREEPQSTPPEPQEKDSALRNRPAEGALRVTAESELNKSWQGGEGAADFLGLDQELRSPAPPGAGDFHAIPVDPIADPISSYADPAAMRMAAMTGGDEHTTQYESSHGNAVTHSPATGTTGVVGGQDTDVVLQAGDGDADESWLLSADEDTILSDHDDLPDDEMLYATEGAGSRFAGGKLVAFLGLALLLGGGGYLYSIGELDRFLPQGGGDTQVATAPTTPTVPVTPRTETPATPSGGDETMTPEGLMSEFAELVAEVEDLEGPTGSDPTIPGDEPAQVAQAGPETEPRTTDPAPGPNAAGETGTEPGAGDARTAVAEEPQGEVAGEDRESRSVTLEPEDMVVVPETHSKLRRASATDLQRLWPHEEIPLDRMDTAWKVLTPNVGRVRVVIEGDEVFEGRLYAVGERHVWLENDIGQTALSSSIVKSVQQLSTSATAPELGGQGAQTLAGLPRVRVKTAGGNFYGKVVAREGKMVTLIPDSGGRITLESMQVEVVGDMLTTLIAPAPKDEVVDGQ